MTEQSGVRYELDITPEEARLGSKKLLTRNGKRLEVTIPPSVNTGSTVRLANALQLTDNRQGDILIQSRYPRAEPVALYSPSFA